MNKGFWEAVFLIAGTTIGAGIFGIPYITAHVGYPIGLMWLIGLTLFVIFVNQLYARIILKTGKKPMQLVGYGERYLGKKGKYLALCIILIGQWGALLAYIIGIGSFLAVITNTLELSYLWSVIFFIVAAIITIFNLRVVAVLETWLTLGMILIVSLIVINGVGFFQVSNFYIAPDLDLVKFLSPYGVIFGALGGFAVIPEVGRIIQGSKLSPQHFFRAVALGTLIPGIVYLFFQVTVVGVSGFKTSEEAIQGLLPYLDVGVVRLGALFGTLAMFSSFLTLTHVLKDTFYYDYGFSSFRAWFLAVMPPFLVFLAGLTSFIVVLEFMGLWVGTGSAIFIILLYRKVQLIVKHKGIRD